MKKSAILRCFGRQNTCRCFCSCWSCIQWYFISIDFVRLGLIDLLMKPAAVELSVWMGIADCGRCRAVSVRAKGMLIFALWYTAPSSASAADVTTCLRMGYSQ